MRPRKTLGRQNKFKRFLATGNLGHSRKRLIRVVHSENYLGSQFMLLVDYLSIKLQFLRVSVRMPLEQLICLIRAKFVSREGATIELHCNDFFLYSSSSTSPDDQLFSPKTTFFEIFLRIWYPNKKSQPMQIIYREVF